MIWIILTVLPGVSIIQIQEDASKSGWLTAGQKRQELQTLKDTADPDLSDLPKNLKTKADDNCFCLPWPV